LTAKTYSAGYGIVQVKKIPQSKLQIVQPALGLMPVYIAFLSILNIAS
jgi:hypothetical protein